MTKINGEYMCCVIMDASCLIEMPALIDTLPQHSLVDYELEQVLQLTWVSLLTVHLSANKLFNSIHAFL